MTSKHLKMGSRGTFEDRAAGFITSSVIKIPLRNRTLRHVPPALPWSPSGELGGTHCANPPPLTTSPKHRERWPAANNTSLKYVIVTLDVNPSSGVPASLFVFRGCRQTFPIFLFFFFLMQKRPQRAGNHSPSGFPEIFAHPS